MNSYLLMPVRGGEDFASKLLCFRFAPQPFDPGLLNIPLFRNMYILGLFEINEGEFLTTPLGYRSWLTVINEKLYIKIPLEDDDE